MNKIPPQITRSRTRFAKPERFSLLVFTWLAMVGFATTLPAASWSSVPLGGGGFVTGLVSDSSGNDIYCRSDVGGAFRWNAATTSWDSISDKMVSNDVDFAAALMSISSIAVDPGNANLIYTACGSAASGTSDTTLPNVSMKGIYASTNKGSTWTAINTTLSILGSDSVRSYGERLMVDPNNSNILWFGSRLEGLQKATKSGSTWTWTQIPSTSVPFGETDFGVVFVACDKNAGSTIIYAGVYDAAVGGIYKSTDGGVSWTKVTGATITTPRRASMAANGTLYISTGTTGVFKLPRGGTLMALSALPTGYVYHGVAAAPSDLSGNTVFVAQSGSSIQYCRIWRSDDGGSSWAMQYQNFNNLVLTRTEPDGTPACGGYWFANTSSLLVNPADPNELWASDFFGVARTQDAQNLGTTNGCYWYMLQKGQDETCVGALKNSPNGVRLISGIGDVGGWRYLNTYDRPAGTNGSALSIPGGGSNSSLDFCESNENVWARAWLNAAGSGGSGAISSDGGATWAPFGTVTKKTVVNSSTAGPETWNVTPYLAAQKAKGINTVTLVMMSNVSSVTTMLTFDSKEATTSTLRPKVVINGTTDLLPIADSYVYGATASATTNFGNATTLQISSYPGDATRMRWTYLKFDLTSVGAITEATLQLNRRSATNTTTFNVYVFACSNLTWVEGNGGTDNSPANEITWTNKPPTLATSTTPAYIDPFKYPDYAGLKAGNVAVSATDPNNMIWLPLGAGQAIRYSKDRGASWTTSSGGPASQRNSLYDPSSCLQQITSDRVNGNFYAAKFGDFSTGDCLLYKSTNGGATWTAITPIPSQFNTFRCQLVAAPGAAGDLWVSDDLKGLWHSTDAGTTWTRLSSSKILSVRTISFGKPLAGSSFPYTVFINAVYYNFTSTQRDIYRSDDGGVNWVNLGMPTIQNADSLAGDRQVYGQVFVGTQGRGTFQYGSNISSVDAEADTYVYDGNPTGNYGAATELWVKDASPGADRISYVRFPVSGTVSSATLKLTVAGIGGESPGNRTVNVRELSDDTWSETGMTWNTRAASSGTIIGTILNADTVGQTYTVDVTSYVNAQSSDGKASFCLSQPITSGKLVYFGSREHATYKIELEIVQ